MALKYAGFGIKEMARSLIMPLQVKQVQRYIEDLVNENVERGPAGVRAQAMGKDGMLLIYKFYLKHHNYSLVSIFFCLCNMHLN